MRQIGKRLAALEASVAAGGRQFMCFRWSSQDPDEALRRWKARQPDLVLEPEDEVVFVVWRDPDGTMADEWGAAASCQG